MNNNFVFQQIETLTKSNANNEQQLKYHKTSIHRIQKKLILVAKERELYKSLMDSYEKELTSRTIF